MGGFEFYCPPRIVFGAGWFGKPGDLAGGPGRTSSMKRNPVELPSQVLAGVLSSALWPAPMQRPDYR